MTLCPKCFIMFDGKGGRGCPNCGRGRRKDKGKRGNKKPPNK